MKIRSAVRSLHSEEGHRGQRSPLSGRTAAAVEGVGPIASVVAVEEFFQGSLALA